jgi:hypothetical protein
VARRIEGGIVSAALSELETRAAQLGYHYDGILRVGNPETWIITLVDSTGGELSFQGDTIEDAIEVATDRMALLSGMVDL